MNILFYQHQYPAFGGIETVTTLLATQFANDGHSVAIVSSLSKPGTNLLERLPQAVRFWKLPVDARQLSNENRVRLLGILSEFKPDVVLFQDSYARIEDTLFAAFEAYRAGKPLDIVVEHNTPRLPSSNYTPIFKSIRHFIGVIYSFVFRPVISRRRLAIERARRRKLYQFSDKYVFLSPRYIPLSNAIAAIESCEKLLAIPNPLKEPTLMPDLTVKRKEILFCGSLIPTKGVDRLIDIWAKVEAKHPDWCFTVVGDGAERGKLEAQVMRHKLQRVRFEGFQSNPEPYYHRASIFVMASNFEGWPMVLGEAMQQGCVPVAYDSFASIHDIVDDGVSGRIISHFNQDGFIAALDDLINDADLLLRFQKGAMEKSRQFSLSRITKSWYALFDQMLGGGAKMVICEHSLPMV